MSEGAPEEHSEPPESSGPRAFDVVVVLESAESDARAFGVLAALAVTYRPHVLSLNR